jgi:hypothetical protein
MVHPTTHQCTVFISSPPHSSPHMGWSGPSGCQGPPCGLGVELGPVGRLFMHVFGEFRKVDQIRPDLGILRRHPHFSKRPQKRCLGRLGLQFGHSIRLEQSYIGKKLKMFTFGVRPPIVVPNSLQEGRPGDFLEPL